MPIPKAKYKVWDEAWGELWLCKIISREYRPKDEISDWEWWYEVEYYEPRDSVPEDALS